MGLHYETISSINIQTVSFMITCYVYYTVVNSIVIHFTTKWKKHQTTYVLSQLYDTHICC